MSQKIDSLVVRLREASSAYFLGQPVMSDAEFDGLRDELASLDPSNPFLSEVGTSVESSPLQKVRHVMPMGSLDKCSGDKREKGFQTWVKSCVRNPNTVVTVQWKLDGASVELIYENGQFVQALTRGDGITGEDITHTIKTCAPKRIKSGPGRVYIRAEAVLKLETWRAHFANDFANPRNTVSGIVRRISEAAEAKHVTILAHDLLGDTRAETEFDKITALQKMGFETVDTWTCPVNEVPDVASHLESKRDTIPYEVDGLVIKINDVRMQEQLGGRNDGCPKWALAWKFAPQGGFTRMYGVEWNVGTTGRITPVALIDPIPVAGVTIRRANLHNADEIDRLGVQIGDTIEVIRSGDVIPTIIRVTEQGKNRIPAKPDCCPSCKEPVTREGPMWVCNNDACHGVSFRRLSSWVNKRNIMHLGKVRLRTLYDNGVVTLIDLYKLTEHDLVEKGISAGMANKIFAELQKSRTATLSDFIGSLSIDMLGRTEARNLVKRGVNTVDDFLALSHDRLMQYDGYQTTKATRIANGIQENCQLVLALLHFFTLVAESGPAKGNGKLNGQSFCFTGAASRSRDELHAMVEAAGGVVKTSITADLNFLVMADPDSVSGKAKKAREKGTTIISEQQFMEMLS